MTDRKKILLENFINTNFEKEINYLFGDDSKVKINNIIYSTQKKNYLIDATINVTNIEYSYDSYPDGLVFYLIESCKFLKFYGDGPIILSSIILKD